MMLTKDSTVLVIIDVQGKLAQLMPNRDELFRNLHNLIKGVQLFNIPIIWTEQTPDKLGPTIPELSDLLQDLTPIPKKSFSCCAEPVFMKQLISLKRTEVILCGIETHVCVYQTAVDLLAKDYKVEVVVDAVSSRFPHNKTIGLEKIAKKGAEPTTVETVLFEIQQRVDDDTFRELIKIIK